MLVEILNFLIQSIGLLIYRLIYTDPGVSMISKCTQYKLYAGTKKGEFDGWEEIDVDRADLIECRTLQLGNGYAFDHVKMRVKSLFKTKIVDRTSIRMDRTLDDPDGDFRDLDMHVLFDVNIVVSEDCLKFESRDKSFVMLSREPVDWKDFEKGAPVPDEPETDRYSSFYR